MFPSISPRLTAACNKAATSTNKATLLLRGLATSSHDQFHKARSRDSRHRVGYSKGNARSANVPEVSYFAEGAQVAAHSSVWTDLYVPPTNLASSTESLPSTVDNSASSLSRFDNRDVHAYRSHRSSGLGGELSIVELSQFDEGGVSAEPDDYFSTYLSEPAVSTRTQSISSKPAYPTTVSNQKQRPRSQTPLKKGKSAVFASATPSASNVPSSTRATSAFSAKSKPGYAPRTPKQVVFASSGTAASTPSIRSSDRLGHSSQQEFATLYNEIANSSVEEATQRFFNLSPHESVSVLRLARYGRAAAPGTVEAAQSEVILMGMINALQLQIGDGAVKDSKTGEYPPLRPLSDQWTPDLCDTVIARLANHRKCPPPSVLSALLRPIYNQLVTTHEGKTAANACTNMLNIGLVCPELIIRLDTIIGQGLIRDPNKILKLGPKAVRLHADLCLKRVHMPILPTALVRALAAVSQGQDPRTNHWWDKWRDPVAVPYPNLVPKIFADLSMAGASVRQLRAAVPSVLYRILAPTGAPIPRSTSDFAGVPPIETQAIRFSAAGASELLRMMAGLAMDESEAQADVDLYRDTALHPTSAFGTAVEEGMDVETFLQRSAPFFAAFVNKVNDCYQSTPRSLLNRLFEHVASTPAGPDGRVLLPASFDDDSTLPDDSTDASNLSSQVPRIVNMLSVFSPEEQRQLVVWMNVWNTLGPSIPSTKSSTSTSQGQDNLGVFVSSKDVLVSLGSVAAAGRRLELLRERYPDLLAKVPSIHPELVSSISQVIKRARSESLQSVTGQLTQTHADAMAPISDSTNASSTTAAPVASRSTSFADPSVLQTEAKFASVSHFQTILTRRLNTLLSGLKQQHQRREALRAKLAAPGEASEAAAESSAPITLSNVPIEDWMVQPLVELGDPSLEVCVGDYVLDIAWEKLQVALEIDGTEHFAPPSGSELQKALLSIVNAAHHPTTDPYTLRPTDSYSTNAVLGPPTCVYSRLTDTSPLFAEAWNFRVQAMEQAGEASSSNGKEENTPSTSMQGAANLPTPVHLLRHTERVRREEIKALGWRVAHVTFLQVSSIIPTLCCLSWTPFLDLQLYQLQHLSNSNPNVNNSYSSQPVGYIDSAQFSESLSEASSLASMWRSKLQARSNEGEIIQDVAWNMNPHLTSQVALLDAHLVKYVLPHIAQSVVSANSK